MGTPRNNTQSLARALAGRRVLVCRPQPEASRLADLFRDHGADCRVLPALERHPLPETPEARTTIKNLDLFQHVIAVSPYAAGQLLERADVWWPQLPAGLNWYGVGRGTAAVLAAGGLSPIIPATGVTSEALLAHPELLTIRGHKVLIARGEQGRELIRDTLMSRGAEVTLLPLYRRSMPDYSDNDLQQLLGDFQPEVVVTLSGETLNNFIALSENSGHNYTQSLLLVPVQRVAEQAARAGFSRYCIPHSLQDEAIVETIAEAIAREPSSNTIPD